MKYQIILPLILLGSSLFGQPTTVLPCQLVTLTELLLENNPSIQQQRLMVEQAKADKKSAASSFDYQLMSELSASRSRLELNAQDPLASLLSKQKNNNLSVRSSLQKNFRAGFLVNAELEYSKLSDNVPFNRYEELEPPFTVDNMASVSLSSKVPVLRGRGFYFNTAEEKAAAIYIESETYGVNITSAEALSSLAAAYWYYLNATEGLAIYVENENRGRLLLEMTTELVKAEQKPASDLIQIQADLANLGRQRLLAEQELYAARQNLGRSIGLRVGDSEGMGPPLDKFPTLENANFHDKINLEAMLQLANENRAELKALSKGNEALELLVELRNNELKPQLDLGAFVAYKGMDKGRGHPAISSLGKKEDRTMEVGLSLNLLFPLNNNLAEAKLLTQKIALAEQQISLNDQVRNIHLNVSIALNDVKNNADYLKKTEETVQLFTEAYNNEQLKFKNGLTTLVNLILFREKLTAAELDYLQAKLQFALAINQLRFETGTLVPMNTSFLIGEEIFYQIPK